MSFESDPKVQAKIRQLERQEQAVAAGAKREASAGRRRVLARSLKKRILFYAALAIAVVLVWQKLHIVIFIPGTFATLFIILGGIFLALYLAMTWLFDSD